MRDEFRAMRSANSRRTACMFIRSRCGVAFELTAEAYSRWVPASLDSMYSNITRGYHHD
jgi:hypothetical protein